MAWTKIAKPVVISGHNKVSKLAREFAEMTPAPGDRNFRDARAERIKSAILSGRFRTGNMASAFCKENGQTYRVNGKHTSFVLSEMNGETPDDIDISVERYEADTLQDVAALYSTFDPGWSTRSTGDINRAYAGSVEELHGVSSRIINLAVTGIGFVRYGQELYTIQPELRAQLVVDNKEFVIWLNGMIGKSSKESRILKRSATVAAMFSTWAKSQKSASQFWNLVVTADGPDKSSPDRVLNYYLLTHSLRSGAIGGGSIGGNKAETIRAMYTRCIHAWNAWRKGKTTDLKYFPSAELPKAV